MSKLIEIVVFLSILVVPFIGFIYLLGTHEAVKTGIITLVLGV